MNENIAERKLFSISPDGQKKFLKITIGKPYQVDDVSWACPVNWENIDLQRGNNCHPSEA